MVSGGVYMRVYIIRKNEGGGSTLYDPVFAHIRTIIRGYIY